MLLADSAKYPVIRRVVTAIVYASAALATGNWVVYALWSEQQYYGNWFVHTLLRIAVVGSVVFGSACVVSLFQLRYAVVLGSVAACLSWIYFAPFAAYLPWRDFVWLVRFRDHGDAQVAAVLFLLIATVYSLFEAWKWKRARERSV